MTKPIALICNSAHSGRKYLYEKFKSSPARMFNTAGTFIEFSDGTQIIIITSLGEVQGREFSGFWVHPEYQDELIAAVVARVK